MRHRYVIALVGILCCLLNNSNGLSSEEDLLANKCPPSVFVPTHGATRTVTWTPPYAQNRTGILKHIKAHPKEAIPPFEAPKGETHIKYTLTLGNGKETSCSFKITVFKGITITEGNSGTYNVVEGISFRLKCYVDNPDKISYKWLFNDKPLKYDGHRFWDAAYHSLILKRLALYHSGKYTCVAYTTGKRISEASVSTYVKLHEKIKVVKMPAKDTISIIVGDSLRLPCKANYPDGQVSYEWFLDGSLLKYDNHSEWRASHHELSLKSLQVKHFGTYTCQVTNRWGTSSMNVKIKIRAENFSFTTWGGWSKCLSTPGSNIGHRSRFRTCVTSSDKEAPGKCSGKTKQTVNCDVEVSTPSPPVRTPTPTPTASEFPATLPVTKSTEKAIIRTQARTPTPAATASVIPVTLPVKRKEELIVAVRKVVAPSDSKGKSKFLDTFYGKLALGSSFAILVLILGCAVFVLVGRRIEKKDKKKRRGYTPIKDLEDTPLNDGPSNEEYSDDYEDEMDRKAFEKRRVIKELTPKGRKRSELDDDLIVARAIILEEGINKKHEKEVAEKRKMVVNSTSSAGCKKSLLESINSSRAIILETDTTNVDNAERASVSFSPRKEHKPRISSGGSSRGSSYHSLDGTKNTQNGNDDDSFSMMMVQPVQPLTFEARQATIKHTQDFDLKQ